MNFKDLEIKLRENNVPERWYGINELKSDACILYQNYLKWEFFYLDEKGDRNDFKIFLNEDDACNYLWDKIEYQLKIFGR